MGRAYALKDAEYGFVKVHQLHQLPGVSDEEFAETLAKYGMRKKAQKGEIPQIHNVIVDTKSEYYQKHLKALVEAERERKRLERQRQHEQILKNAAELMSDPDAVETD